MKNNSVSAYNIQNIIRFLFIGSSIIGVIYALICGRFVISDSIEHLRASFLVSAGYVPYRDFFEHHHPLLWYMFAPIIKILPHNALLVYYVAKCFMLFISVLAFGVIYRLITNFLGNRELFVWFVMSLSCFFPIWYCVSLIKPDVAAYLFYFIGLYYFFDYIRTRRTAALIYCMLAAAVAFLFLQTIAMSIILWIVPCLIIFCRNRKFYRDLILALPCPLLLLGGCAYFIYIQNAMLQYVQQNWILNMQLFSLLQTEAPSTLVFWTIPLAAVLIGSIWLLLRRNTPQSWIIIAFLFIGEIAQRLYFKAVFPHYLVLTFIFAAMLAAYLLTLCNRRLIYNYMYAYIGICIILNFMTLRINDNAQILADYQEVNQSEKAAVFNVDFSMTNIYASLNYYYTATFNNLAIIDNHLFNRFPDYNINNELYSHRYQYLNYNTRHANITTVEPDMRFIVSEETLQNYQQISPQLYQLKENITGDY